MMMNVFKLILPAAILLMAACDSDKEIIEAPTPDPEPPVEEVKYEAPGYPDDYSAISGWNNRASWNLANVHDPTVEKCGEYFYMYGTNASYGNAHEGNGNFHYRRSKDLVNWEYRGASMNTVPAWVSDTLNNMRARQGLSPISEPSYGFWAPVVRKVGDKYRMYYSIVIDNYISTGKPNTVENFDGSWTERAFIGMRETKDLSTNLWVDRGMVLCSYTDKGMNWSRPNINNWSGYFKWNAIDPTMVITPTGENWLVYGSWHSGIVAVELDPSTGLLKNKPGEPWESDNNKCYGTQIYTRTKGSRWQASEGPEVIYNEKTGYYYLFLAYDELSVAYNTRVCRSKSITGPFVDIKGNDLTNGGECWPMLTHPYKFNNHSGWVGFAHCAVFKDDNDQWYYSSQGRLPANTNGNAYSNAIMMGHINEIEWTEDGWPVVMPERYAAVPKTDIKAQDLAGEWEHISMQYSFQKQQTSKLLTLSEDNKATGAISGTWSFDAASNTLSIGSIKLIVKRGLDWESNPRKQTLIYSGLTSDGKPLWGKKKL